MQDISSEEDNDADTDDTSIQNNNSDEEGENNNGSEEGGEKNSGGEMESNVGGAQQQGDEVMNESLYADGINIIGGPSVSFTIYIYIINIFNLF